MHRFFGVQPAFLSGQVFRPIANTLLEVGIGSGSRVASSMKRMKRHSLRAVFLSETKPQRRSPLPRKNPMLPG